MELMKVLWFSLTPSLYKNTTNHPYFGAGWIESLQKIIETDNNIDLAIAFFHSDAVFKVKQNATIYYPISIREGKIHKIKNNLFLNQSDREEVDYFHRIVNDFNPDLIHIFGSERSFGLLCNSVKVPIVLHVQGLLNPCFNSYFIPGMSKFDFLLSLWGFLYFNVSMFGGKYVNFLNGISALRIQFLSCIISPFLYVAIAILLIKHYQMGVYSLFIASIIANFNAYLLSPLQYYQIIIKKSKSDIWYK